MWNEVHPDIFVKRLFSQAECERWLKRIAEQPRDRREAPNSMNKYGIVLGGSLRPALADLVQYVVSPKAVWYPDIRPLKKHPYAFSIDYSVKTQKSLAAHHDSSDVTLNVCLSGEEVHRRRPGVRVGPEALRAEARGRPGRDSQGVTRASGDAAAVRRAHQPDSLVRAEEEPGNMSAPVCVTCGSAKCGNHAACARRQVSCPWAWWSVVSLVEGGVQKVLKKAPRLVALFLMADMEGLRWRVAETIEDELSRRDFR